MKNVLADGRLTQRGGVGAAPTDHICTSRPAGHGERRWSKGAPGQYQRAPLLLHSTSKQSDAIFAS